MEVHWLIDRHLLNRAHHTGRMNIHDAVIAAGHKAVIVDNDLTQQEILGIPDTWDNKCVVVYGSVQFTNKVSKQKGRYFTPGVYNREKNLSFASYAAHHGDILFNDDFYVLPYGEFVRRSKQKFEKSVFIRPVSVMKSFTGFVIKPEDLKHELNSLEKLLHVNEDELIVVASEKKIMSEYRFFIVDNEVITGSQYSWDNILDVRLDVHPKALETANIIAKRQWQPDTVYVCDVAINEDGEGRLLEMNAFSCSGLYAADTEKIVKAVSQSAWNEYYPET